MNARFQSAFRRAAAPVLLALVAGCASAGTSGEMPAMEHEGFLSTSTGMSLYVFDKDPANASKSVCNGPCATNWPPLAAAADAKPMSDWTPITRDDGSKQWAYKGKPLYLWIKDTKPGDRSGDGFNGVWHLARP